MITCLAFLFSICKKIDCRYAHELFKCSAFPKCRFGDECKFVHLSQPLFEEFRTCTATRPYREEIAHELGRLCKVYLKKCPPQQRFRFCPRQILGNFCEAEDNCQECQRNEVDRLLKTEKSHCCSNEKDCGIILNGENMRIIRCYHLYCRTCAELLPERNNAPPELNDGLFSNKCCLLCDEDSLRTAFGNFYT